MDGDVPVTPPPERTGSGNWGGTPTAGRTPATPGAGATPVRPLAPGGTPDRVTVYCRVRPELNADGSVKKAAPGVGPACVRVDVDACQARARCALKCPAPAHDPTRAD